MERSPERGNRDILPQATPDRSEVGPSDNEEINCRSILVSEIFQNTDSYDLHTSKIIELLRPSCCTIFMIYLEILPGIVRSKYNGGSQAS